jgi:predicted RNase H-like nuclease (RuvC/YqgF family)
MSEVNVEQLEKRIQELEAKTEKQKREVEMIIKYIDENLKPTNTYWTDGPIMFYPKNKDLFEKLNDKQK